MKILSARQVSELTSLSIPQIRRMASAGTMPRPVRISGSRVGWVQHDIEAWIEAAANAQNTEAGNAS